MKPRVEKKHGVYWTEKPVMNDEIYCTVEGKTLKHSYQRFPDIGEAVDITVNKTGPGTVVGYFYEYGYAGVIIKPNNPPAWWEAQDAESVLAGVCGVFGAETSLGQAHLRAQDGKALG
jgi:hypothetical protein